MLVSFISSSAQCQVFEQM